MLGILLTIMISLGFIVLPIHLLIIDDMVGLAIWVMIIIIAAITSRIITKNIEES